MYAVEVPLLSNVVSLGLEVSYPPQPSSQLKHYVIWFGPLALTFCCCHVVASAELWYRWLKCAKLASMGGISVTPVQLPLSLDI